MRINKILLAGLLCMALALDAAAKPLSEVWREAMGKQVMQMPDTAEMQAVLQAFKQELQGIKADTVWQRFGMQRLNVEHGITAIAETATARHGRGLFAVRSVSTRHWLLQAPHAESDKGTGALAELLFAEGPFHAAQWNSVPRAAAIAGRAETADLAHITPSYWQAFTQAFAENYADGRVVQLHGFNPAKRKSAAGRTGDMIVSAGNGQTPAWLAKTASCLQTKMPGAVRLYPRDLKELGGTTNAQGQLLHTMGYQGFMHIEMSPQLRRQLLREQKRRLDLIDCLETAEN